MIDNEYFRQYRKQLGFSNQNSIKDFLQAKDIKPNIDFQYIEDLNARLKNIIVKINDIVSENIKCNDLDLFKTDYIDKPFQLIKENGILHRLNNQGRRPEEVYFSWMRGFILSKYFLKALSFIFEVEISQIYSIGDDDFRNIETFKRTPKADIEIQLNDREKIRIEMQSGFGGINDIKQHKVLVAKKVFGDNAYHTIVVHFDIYNGQAAFVKIDAINDNDINWITRQQMEGQTVFNINQNYFIWKLMQEPIKYKDMIFD
ncbi:MAG: restriction endonuclease [Elusimicrobiota bacterium]|jgi:hypothetical protein|nr:restriction endonuclease [Elusimicrobiota bacterium]